MSLPESTSEKVIKLQKNYTFCNNIIQFINCSKHDNYFIDSTGILHKKVVNFNSTFSAIDIPLIFINYLLHASQSFLGHVGVTKLNHFLKWFYYFQGMRRKIHQYVRSCNKCQIMNLQNHTLLTYIKTLHKLHKMTYPLIY